MDASSMNNDTRGWIMCLVSSLACVAGSTVICVDSFVRLFPGNQSFEISKSNTFLAASLSLSVGVMLFSSLYGLLPTSKDYFVKAGFSPQAAGFLLMLSFVAGFLGIQVISRVVHQFMPSHVVDCDHNHEGQTSSNSHFGLTRQRHTEHRHSGDNDENTGQECLSQRSRATSNGKDTESTPLLHTAANPTCTRPSLSRKHSTVSARSTRRRRYSADQSMAEISREPSFIRMSNRVMSFVKDTKPDCHGIGPCHGFTDPCGQECFKRHPILRTTTGTVIMPHAFETGEQVNARASCLPTTDVRAHSSVAGDRDTNCERCDSQEECSEDNGYCSSTLEDIEAQHHHHVSTNAFFSIGLQTSIAIALHKFPEGFVTWASNHANPDLGFNVFMALFTHNIAEGFALAVPLYMALGSRLKAIFWSSILGGLSQPIGAALAVFWFRATRRTAFKPDNTVYAMLFGITAGIMASVALNLFFESLSMKYNRNLTIGFAFLGMVILGASNALVAH